MDLDMVRVALNDLEKENATPDSPCTKAYKKHLSATMFPDADSSRIISFQSKPPGASSSSSAKVLRSSLCGNMANWQRCPERTLDAPEIVDDYYLNLLDWGTNNVLCIALGNTVYLWHASTGLISELMTCSVEDEGPVTSVNWAPDGRHVALGLNNSNVQIWDTECNRQLRSLKGHNARVGSLAWNASILTTGGLDAKIINHDVRIGDHIIETYRGHEQEVCGLKWSLTGQQLACGGNDNLLHIWDQRRSTEIASASGRGSADRCIKFWNTHTGAFLNTIDTGSQVCALLWSKQERELLSSHGYTHNQLTLWKYPSLVKIAELTGHTSRFLSSTESRWLHCSFCSRG